MNYRWKALAVSILMSVCSFAGSCAPSEDTEAPCTTDADCHLAADYCSGRCACVSLTQGQEAPSCSAPSTCLVNPCLGKVATCISGQCSTRDPT
jgi:hypothetical protein